MMQKKSILIGSNGYIGRHLAWHLQKEGFGNLNCDIHPETHHEIQNYRQVDITKKPDIEILNLDVDYIFLFAGLTGTANGFDKYRDFIEVNETGLLNLLTVMRETGSRARIIFPSTRLVYRGQKNHMLSEDDPKEAKTIYAANKLNAENILWMYHNAFGIDYNVFRICVPYGNLFGGEFSYGTIGFFMNKAAKGEDISLFGDGTIRRTFSHVSDISMHIIRAIQSENTANEIYNIGGENLSLLGAAKLVADKFGVSVKFADWPELALKLESDDTVFDDAKLKSKINVVFDYTLARWLGEIRW